MEKLQEKALPEVDDHLFLRVMIIIGLCIVLLTLFWSMPVGKKDLSQEDYTPMDEEQSGEPL